MLFKTLNGQMNKDITIVYVLPKTGRVDSADLSTKLLQYLGCQNNTLAVVSLVLSLRILKNQLFGSKYTVAFILKACSKCFCCKRALH